MSHTTTPSPQPDDLDGLDWRALYHLAFVRFGGRALWNMREFATPSPADALAAARQLRIEGDLPARALAECIERSAGAAL